MKIYRRIINENDKNDDCIYQLILEECGYRWHYRSFTRHSGQYDIPILYKSCSKFRLNGVLDFDPQDLELSDGNSAEYK